MKIKVEAWIREPSAPEMYDILWDTGNRTLEDKKLPDDARQYAAEYLGKLFNYTNETVEAAHLLEEPAKVNIGRMHLASSGQQRAQYGEPMIPELIPDEEGAWERAANSFEGVQTVEKHLVDAVYAHFNIPESNW